MFQEIIQNISDLTRRISGNEKVFELSDLLLMSPLLAYAVSTQKETICSATCAAG